MGYCDWDGEPAYYSRGKAWVFRRDRSFVKGKWFTKGKWVETGEGKWVEPNGHSVGKEARVMSEEAFRRYFGELPPLPEAAVLRETDGSRDAESELHDRLSALYARAFEESSPEFKKLWSDLDKE
jgi:hypothetical protein